MTSILPSVAALLRPCAGRRLAAARRGACTALAGAIAASLAGCASSPSYDPAAPAFATLPLAAAGIRDERATFAAYLQRELDAAPPPAVAAASAASVPQGDAFTWLHPPPAMPALADRVATLPPRASGMALPRVAVLLVPGLFSDCVDEQSVPFGDGVVRPREEIYTAAYAQYADLGLADVRALRTLGRADSEHNGEVVAREVAAEAARGDVDAIVLVAYSKGLPDALHALKAMQVANGLSPKVRALVSVSGVVMGTPIADAHAGQYDSFGGVLSLGPCPKSEGGELRSLERAVQGPWLEHALPLPAIGYYSLVAHEPHADFARGLAGFNDDLSKIDPLNDGQVIVSDAILPHSTLLAAARSDHWLYVLPLAGHPNVLIRGFASDRPFPREALFRAIVRYVTDDLARGAPPAPQR